METSRHNKVTITEGRLLMTVTVPFSKEFVFHAKRLNGQFDGESWVFCSMYADYVKNLCLRLYGTTGSDPDTVGTATIDPGNPVTIRGVAYMKYPVKRGFWFYFFLFVTLVSPFFGANGFIIAAFTAIITLLINRSYFVEQYNGEDYPEVSEENESSLDRDFKEYQTGSPMGWWYRKLNGK